MNQLTTEQYKELNEWFREYTVRYNEKPCWQQMVHRANQIIVRDILKDLYN